MCPRAVDDPAYAEHGGLGVVDDRCRAVHAEHAVVVQGERPTRHLRGAEHAVAGQLGQLAQGSRELCRGHVARRAVASASTQVVTSGISCRLVVTLSAIALRTPRKGTRMSPVRSGRAAPCVGETSPTCRAASTSSRLLTPPAPVGATPVRSIPLSLASFLTTCEITLRAAVVIPGTDPAVPGVA